MNDFSKSLFEQATQISKAHGYDILAKQVGELKENNRELIEILEDSIEKMDAQKLWLIDKEKIKKLIKKAKILSL